MSPSRPALLLCLTIVLGAIPCAPRAAAQAPIPEAEAEILARIQPPQFPARDFVITDFGAIADADCTAAIAKAIAACSAAGGGRVVAPAGMWLTGPVHLRSKVNLHLAEGATLHFSPEPAKYLPVVLTRFEGIECMNYSPLIYAFEQEDVAITGKGTLDGSANWETWWAWNDKSKDDLTRQTPDRKLLDKQGTDGAPVAARIYGGRHFLRPNFIQPYRCKNVLIEGVRDPQFADVGNPSRALLECHGARRHRAQPRHQ